MQVVVSSEKDAELLGTSGLVVERQGGESSGLTFLVTPKGTIPELVRDLVGQGIDIEEISAAHPSLEKEFLTLFRH